MRYFFARLDKKHNLLEILRKLSKFSENFLKKIAKNPLFYHIFQKYLLEIFIC